MNTIPSAGTNSHGELAMYIYLGKLDLSKTYCHICSIKIYDGLFYTIYCKV